MDYQDINHTKDGHYMWRKIHKEEYLLAVKAGKKVRISGSGTITDYKTTYLTSPKDSIPYNYKLQLLCYAYIYRAMGFPVDKIQIIWITQPDINRVSEKTGKPLKDYPCQVVPVTYMLQESDWQLIESILALVAESVKADKTNPELRHVIWKDYRLKAQPKNLFAGFQRA